MSIEVKNDKLFYGGVEVPDNQLFWARVNGKPEAIIPTKDDENAGYDIYAYSKDRKTQYKIEPHSTMLIPTGIAVAVSKNYYLQVQERGSTGKIGMKYGSGVIDSGYRGEIFIVIANVNDYPIIIGPDHKEIHFSSQDGKCTELYYPITKAIAQLIVHNVPKMAPKEISYDDLKSIPSDRGTNSLGSSKK